jgi:gamma-glutamyl:cysteine ligase YbdK (ATP-grasp superfamily)
MPDQPTSVEVSGAFVALLQALCATYLEEDPGPADRALYEEARWAATHYGPRASLPHPDGDRLVDVPELAAELLARIDAPADLLAPLDPTRCEGDRQLEVGDAGGLQAVCADLVERTVR